MGSEPTSDANGRDCPCGGGCCSLPAMSERAGSLRWVIQGMKIGICVPGREKPYFIGDEVRRGGATDERTSDKGKLAFEQAFNYGATKTLNEQNFTLLALLSLAQARPDRLRAVGLQLEPSHGVERAELLRLSCYARFRLSDERATDSLRTYIQNHFRAKPAPVVRIRTWRKTWWVQLQWLAGDIQFDPDVLESIERHLRGQLMARGGEGGATSTRELEELRRLSLSAATTASIVLSSGESGKSVGAVHLGEVYAERTLEKTLLANIVSGPPGSVHLVSGEAGTGKTSLLWHLHEQLAAEHSHETWMLKASMVKEALSLPMLESAAKQVSQLGRTPVLLLDTVDLLLHQEQQSDRLASLVLAAKEAGCTVVITCRPLEAGRLPEILKRALFRPTRDPGAKDAKDKDDSTIAGFDAAELTRAKERYVRRFYGRMSAGEVTRHLDELDRLVAGRHAMAAIMSHPLTMRMLFHLYAPNRIPPEINIVGLYNDYWQRRVCTDTRPGHDHPTDPTDLAGAAGWLALAMLSGSAPVLDERAATLVLRHRGLPVVHITALVDRGVLRREEGRIEFFHQTFFEHASARGILATGAARGIDLLTERTKEHPEDLLVAAVLEQCLIIAPPALTTIRAAVERTMRQLLESRQLSLQSVAVAAYFRMSDDFRALEPLVDTVLSEAVVARRMIALSPSMPEERIPDVFSRFSVIWRASIERQETWRSCQHVLDALSRLACRGGQYARLARRFLEEHPVREVVLQKQAEADAKGPYLALLIGLAPHDPGVWEDLLALVRGVTKDFRARVISAMAGIVDHLRRERPARDLMMFTDELDAAAGPERESDGTDGNRAWGALWDAEWQLRRVATKTILEEITIEHEQRHYRWMLNGLRLYLRRAGRADERAAWNLYLKEPVKKRRMDWNAIVWAELFREIPSPVTDAIIAAAEHLAELLASRERPDETTALAVQLNKVGCPAVLSDRLFSNSLTNDPNRWLDESDLGALLPFAFSAGQTAAVEAMGRLVREPKNHWKIAKGTIGTMCAHPSGKELETIFALASASEKIEFVALALSRIDRLDEAPSAAGAQALHEMLQRALRSSKGTQRSDAARVWLELLRLRVSLPAPMGARQIRENIERESDPTSRAWLVVLLGEIGQVEDDVEETLRQASIAKDVNLRNKALPAWIKFVRRHGLVASRALDVVNAASISPTDAGRLRQAGWLVDDLVPSEMETAGRVLEALFLTEALCELGRQGYRDLRSTLRTPVRKWIAGASVASVRRMLSLVSRTHAEIGCLIVDAVAREAFEPFLADLTLLVQDSEVPAQVRGYIEEQIRIRKTRVVAAPWPALERLIMAE